MIFKIFTFIGMAVSTVLVLWVLGWVWFASAIAFGSQNETPPKSDAIIVLTGGHGRVNAGLDLLAQNTAPKLFISGVNIDTTENDIWQSWKKPISPRPCCITLGHQATDTSGNALEVSEWIIKNNIYTIILVTSRYHMPRAYLEMARSLPAISIHQYVTDSADFQAWKGRFWSLTFSEYNKTLIQAIRFVGYQ